MTEPPRYREYAPGPLAPWVECLWSSAAPASDMVHAVLPDGCMDILFDTARTGEAAVIGTMRKPQEVHFHSAADFWGIRFRPGCLPAFLRLDACDVTDSRAALTDLWGSMAGELWHRLLETPHAARPALLRTALMANAPKEIDPCIGECVARIEASRGLLAMKALVDAGSLSARQIERKFQQHVGLAPKAFARIVRFKRLKAAINRAGSSHDWADMAAAFGFADQPHLVREFKALSGLTPVQYAGNRFFAA